MPRAPWLTVNVTLEHGPLRGTRVDVPSHAVTIIRTMDDGTVVTYERWEDLVFRFDPANSDGSARNQVC
jgi:hypothetical protein